MLKLVSISQQASSSMLDTDIQELFVESDGCWELPQQVRVATSLSICVDSFL